MSLLDTLREQTEGMGLEWVWLNPPANTAARADIGSNLALTFFDSPQHGLGGQVTEQVGAPWFIPIPVTGNDYATPIRRLLGALAVLRGEAVAVPVEASHG